VLGFAELIAETAGEARVKIDALEIAAQARRMRSTVDSLLEFWQPGTKADAAVDVAEMLRELVAKREAEMVRRGVVVVLAIDGECGEVRGVRERLAEVFGHLLTNAVQAVEAGVGARSVRVAVNCDGENVRVVVSDSGAGFADAARVFDPFYTTRQPGEGQGLGLAVSYGIVREHGGEISAFNLHPRGAAVVVELPIGKTVVDVGELQGVGTRD
jgi:C4-dicarboxylate-specific signal transduction histidine kinase